MVFEDIATIPVQNKISCSYNGKEYDDHPNSANNHGFTSLGNLNNTVLAVGAGYNPGYNNKVEIFDINANTWATKTSFPYCSSRYVLILKTNFFNYLGSIHTE